MARITPFSAEYKSILRSAIEATGGPASDAVVEVREYIEQRFEGFPFSAEWSAQIRGFKAGLCARHGLAPFEDPTRAASGSFAEPAPAVSAAESFSAMEEAREFLRRIADDQPAVALERLAYLRDLTGSDRLERIAGAVEIWAELLDAGGDLETAERVWSVLQCLQKRAPATPSLRLFMPPAAA